MYAVVERDIDTNEIVSVLGRYRDKDSADAMGRELAELMETPAEELSLSQGRTPLVLTEDAEDAE